MTTELLWLTLTAILAASLWIPYIVGVNTTTYEGKDAEFVRPPITRRCQRGSIAATVRTSIFSNSSPRSR